MQVRCVFSGRKLLLWLALCAAGCAPMSGGPSLTLLSADLDRTSPQLEVLDDRITDSDTQTWALLFLLSGPMRPSHETVLDRILEQYDADLLVEAEMKSVTRGIPYIFMQMKQEVSGYPARFVEGGR